MNQQAETAFSHYKDLADNWLKYNPDMYVCAQELIKYIESVKVLESPVNENLQAGIVDVSSIDNKLLLEVLATRLRDDKVYKESVELIPDTHDCGCHLTVTNWEGLFKASCDQCGIEGIWRDKKETAVKFFKAANV
jgi:predicted RNA-binding Zn-ribbon protein involved in translation (DUF1610 family)